MPGFFKGHKRTKDKSKLTPQQVFEIRQYKKNIPITIVAEMFQVSISLIAAIQKGYKHKNGTKSKFKARKPNSNRKLTSFACSLLKWYYKRGYSQCKLAKDFKIDQSTVFSIVHGHSYKDI